MSTAVAQPSPLGMGGAVRYLVQLAVVGALYWVCAKGGLTLASINASATPIWPATGLALAATLLFGYRMAPAIFAAAFLINSETAGTIATSLIIGAGNTLEALAAMAIIRRICSADIFSSPVSIAKFGLVCVVITPLAATVGVATLGTAGYVSLDDFGSVWATWWLGDLGGAIVVAPAIILWAKSKRAMFKGEEILESFAVFLAAAVVGLIAFSPFAAQTANRGALAFLAILPLMWAALRRGERDTATVALVLGAFAVWGTMAGSGPFASPFANDAFILLTIFMISTTIPSLALASEVSGRARVETELRVVKTQVAQLRDALETERAARAAEEQLTRRRA